MPSGKAEFNGQLIDVIADRPPIDRGSTIVVVQAHANRVLVRAVEA
jgi:membrane-bound ClpP family serine protease